ncbi:MAG TPA: antibiotic biosynthesis monooxygenase [Gemmatimonadales bacterium]
MNYRIARFKVRASEAPAVEKAIIAFVGQVADEPGTLRYESFREPDGVSYVHLMIFADDDAQAKHEGTAHMKAFLAELHPRCEEGPVFTDLGKVSGAGR